jgi:hypothetical protein
MQLIFIYGPVASGKLTIARELAGRTGVALFHNHLVVDAVSAVFPFGSEAFSRLREQFWLAVFDEAASQGRTLIFTFAPEPTVAPDFPDRVRELIEEKGGQTVFVALVLPPTEQERRLVEEGRAAFGKMRDLSLLRKLRPEFDACMAAMPQPALTLNVNDLTPSASAEAISRLISI